MLAGAALVLGAAAARGQTVRLDHVPIAVRDLDAAVRTYRDELGFSIKPGRPHANSIRNAHIKFADGSALELITASEPRDALAARYLELLADREGGAFLALHAGPIGRLARSLAALETPFDTTVGAYFEWLTFPRDAPLEYLFFIVIHRRPPDLPEHLAHANTARRLYAVWIARAEPEAELELLAALDAPARNAPISLPGAASVREVRLGSGRLYLLEPHATGDGGRRHTGGRPDPGGRSNPAAPSNVRGPRVLGVGGRPDASDRPVVGATVEVGDVDRAAAALGPAARRSAIHGSDSRGRFIRIPPASAHGMWLELLEPAGG
ncbi:MAG TPA: VOC family protein [Longimicrobiales bacterium]